MPSEHSEDTPIRSGGNLFIHCKHWETNVAKAGSLQLPARRSTERLDFAGIQDPTQEFYPTDEHLRTDRT
ncbi:MAG: hypothetical protein AAGG44_05805 [Planctomycetota bacterium]